MIRMLRSLSLSLALFALVGCNADASDDGDDDVDVGEQDLQAACVIDTSCPSSLALLQARSFARGERPDARFRSDLSVVGGREPTPRIIRQMTSRPFTLPEGKTLVLSGDAEGRAPIAIDNFILVEVLDTATGALVDSAYFGSVGDVQRDGTALRRIGEKSYSFEAGTISLSGVIPTGKSVRLRVTALDHGGEAGVSAVFAQAATVVAPPEPPSDPNSCSTAPLTIAKVMRLIPAGRTQASLGRISLRMKQRTCTRATGCSEWSETRKSGIAGDVLVQYQDFGNNGFAPYLYLNFPNPIADTSCPIRPDGSGRFTCGQFKTDTCTPFRSTCDDIKKITLTGEIHEGCISVKGSSTWERSGGVWVEFAYTGLTQI